MSDNITILISHDSGDEKIAFELKTFIEDVFLNVSVYVSGRDLVGGETWIEQIKYRLKSSRVIISLLTSKSLKNNWVYFESGAGFTEDKTIPLLTDNIKPKDLTAPMSLLQARVISESGIEMFIKDLSRKLDAREPRNYPSIKGLLSRVEKILRNESTLELQSLTPKLKVAPNAEKQWIYQDNCLVHDYLIGEKYKIAVDTFFYIDKTEIQLFERSDSKEYLVNTMCQTDTFLPEPFTQYEMKGHRLIFKRFHTNERIEEVASSLTDLLTRIENYKSKLVN